MKLYVIDHEQTAYAAMRGEGHDVYREATDLEIRDAWKALSDKREEEARRNRMTDAEKDLEAIKEAKAEGDFKKGNEIIRKRNVWRQGGSMFNNASYDYWDGSRLSWHGDVNPGYKPYWG